MIFGMMIDPSIRPFALRSFMLKEMAGANL
jgi:hypothetical protein